MPYKNLSRSFRKILCVSAISLFFTAASFAQGPSSGDETQSKFFAGGGFGLSFGRYTLVSLTPQIGYRFNRFLSSGIGFNLLYTSEKERYNGADYSKTTQGIAGLNVFTRFYPIQRFLIQVQPEANYRFGNVRYYSPPGKYKLDAEIVPSVLVGGGLVSPMRNGAMLLTVMYDVLQNPDAPYGKRPIVNVGYNFNF